MQLSLPLIGGSRPVARSSRRNISHSTMRATRRCSRASPIYLLKVRGLSMRDAGIFDGDLLAVQKRSEAKDGQIIIARLGDDVTVKRLKRRPNGIELIAENPDYENIFVETGSADFAGRHCCGSDSPRRVLIALAGLVACQYTVHRRINPSPATTTAAHTLNRPESLMERLACLLPFRQFGRLRHLRKLVPCSLIEASTAATASLFDSPVNGSGAHAGSSSLQASLLPSSLPAFARVSLNSGSIPRSRRAGRQCGFITGRRGSSWSAPWTRCAE